ncbi:MAG: polymerase III, subunit gamma and tau protein [Candidatus Kaiserbacteria bacterium GW2011_GWA2_49_19]|uniref:DNA polymerase III subunit gamma/tau n=1 Tax=Candidatus Kaiserbacteria bacterium GW2011_GWA2_49_19 TaxID=1618669 RepID=A0A0G1VSJ5_9BACT|nr:MAG: polymerase III, subunit gamma and tau protein [Candidatus Kaiserbacteria bacterium GW2011_GWA2_49_19]
MSEPTALYRKYRPKAFKDVIGQEHIVKTLEGALKLGNIFHAYLFAGSRGTGKTTLARIVAREIGASVNDIYEIDAASNNGVDEMRLLNEAVSTLPLESTYKVYIFDEVHMFSKSAFNALLKTLEEPPKHVVFIFATTEIDKLPETVISRCQVFQLKKPTREILKQSISVVAKKEGFTLDAGAADLIALLGDGSFRDAQGILQKVLSASKDKKVALAEVEMVTGAPRGEIVNGFIEALEAKKLPQAIASLHQALAANVDAKVFLKLVLQKLRLVLLLKYAKEMEKEISEEVSPDDFAFIKKLASAADSSISSVLLSELLVAYDAVGRAYIPALPIELALVRLFGAGR